MHEYTVPKLPLANDCTWPDPEFRSVKLDVRFPSQEVGGVGSLKPETTRKSHFLLY